MYNIDIYIYIHHTHTHISICILYIYYMPIKFAVSILFGSLARCAQRSSLTPESCWMDWKLRRSAPFLNVGLKSLEDWKIGRRTFLSKRMLPVEFIEWEYDGSDLLVEIKGTWLAWNNFLGMSPQWEHGGIYHVEFPIDRGSSEINTTMG